MTLFLLITLAVVILVPVTAICALATYVYKLLRDIRAKLKELDPS